MNIIISNCNNTLSLRAEVNNNIEVEENKICAKKLKETGSTLCYEKQCFSVKIYFFKQMFNKKNKFTFTSKRFASPKVDYVKIDKITSGKTIDQIESKGSTFAFHGVVDAESLYELITSYQFYLVMCLLTIPILISQYVSIECSNLHNFTLLFLQVKRYINLPLNGKKSFSKKNENH
ncbi:hypothetical protein pb186bvf_007510 [Paramecium bursaria]